MTTEEKKWVLPASIPFADLKSRDLEECLYWLFDAMGAKDLEWRTGGSGGGAADGGRDLEAHFHLPTADLDMDPQVWWIECKGRAGTVESDEVKSACVNAQARTGLDYLVVATNTQFSNPTRDWVKEFQKKNPHPRSCGQMGFPNHLMSDSTLLFEEGSGASRVDERRGMGVLRAFPDREPDAGRAATAGPSARAGWRAVCDAYGRAVA